MMQILNGLNWTICLNFNYFAIILFVLTMFVICCVSLFTERPLESQLQGFPLEENCLKDH